MGISEEGKRKREKVRKYLLTKQGRDATDYAVSMLLNVSRGLVGTVRRLLILSGEHPPRPDLYKPGAVPRGGYVYGPDGRVMPKDEYQQLLTGTKKKTGRQR